MTNQTAAGLPDVPRARTDDILSMLAERLGASFTASSVFGAAVERDGVTVIPVATVRFALGGGSGTDPERQQRGDGGGGGGVGVPTGYIEIRDGGSEFVPIARPARTAALAAGAAVAGIAIIWAARPRRS